MLLFLALLTPALANSAGRTGSSTTGCTCHSASSSSTTSSTLAASATTVAPGDVVSLTLIVTSSSGLRTYGGLDVSATGGTLAAGTNTRVASGEVTHSAASAMSSGSITYDFTWTAPSSESTFTVRGAGLAANNNGNDVGDAWNRATSITITVDDGCEDLDGDGYDECEDGTGTDCDDADGDINPGADEECDSIDNDCDGDTDEASAIDAETWYADADADGYGLSSSFTVACDPPTGTSADDTDCNDGDGAVHPGATEVCDLVDNDCDTDIDPSTSADALIWYVDVDGDGYAGATTTLACNQPSGTGTSDEDCDDALPGVNPGAIETCDGVDQDCDGATDESSSDATTWFLDGDSDGYGLSTSTVADCTLPAGYASLAGDCNDADAAFNPAAAEACTDESDFNCDGSLAYEDRDSDTFAACAECDDGDAAVYPGAPESCNGVDDDCDGVVDPDSAVDAASWYADTDRDGYGDLSSTSVSCTAPSGSVSDDTDCDDSDPTAFPGAPETCDGADDDCNGTTDEDTAADASVWYADADGDGFGDALATATSCSAPTGYLADDHDCDDTDGAISPAGSELCNGSDDDCDGVTDEPDAADATFWYADTDGDGYGDPLNASIACDEPAGSVADAADCDDTVGAVNPAATEVWYDGVDDDCDGNDADQDLDGWPSPADCNDSDPLINADGIDVVYDGVDTDCSGGSDYDADQDGFDSEAYGGTDCDDADPTTYTGAPELPDDGVENDCDLRNDHDRDDDGYEGEAFGGDDCDDADSTVNPNADDEWYDGLDTDCDGGDDYDQDRDGFPVTEDCDDTDREISSGCDTGGADTGDTGGHDDDSGDDDAKPDCAGCASTSGVATMGTILALAALSRRRRS